MSQNLITTILSQEELSLKPGSSAVSFDVTVINESDGFATFQLDLIAPGVEQNSQRRWYELMPEISAKNPPGDLTQFHVKIIDAPIAGFSGDVNLTVRTFSLELGEDRKLVRLSVDQATNLPLNLQLLDKKLAAHPLEQVEIRVKVTNPYQKLSHAILSLIGIPPHWLSTGSQQNLKIDPGSSAEASFICQLPSITQTTSGYLPFAIQVTHQNGNASEATGVLEILPAGEVEFSYQPTRHQLPPKGTRWQQWWTDLATYTLHCTNQSNLQQQVSINVRGERDRCTLQLLPDQPKLQPGEKIPIQLTASMRRPWFGFGKELSFNMEGVLSDRRVDSLQSTQLLELKVFPRLPLWLQLVLLLMLLWFLWAISWYNPDNPLFGHQETVNTVQFNGTGDELLSGSDDRTVIRWNPFNFFNPIANSHLGVVGDTQKAVRAIRYRPVNNDWVAVGLENGEIQLWHLGTPQNYSTFSSQKDDRVMSLEFSRDARYLFSAHASGTILQWDVKNYYTEGSLPQQTDPRSKQFGFAIYDTAVVGNETQQLVVGGRYNQLALWDWNQDEPVSIAYPRVGGQNDYIASVASAEHQPYLLATADYQGYITLWNLRPCLSGIGACEVLEEWQDGHGGKAVRSLAFSEYGCYLASAGEDGRVMLWTLTAQGKRSLPFYNGTEIVRNPNSFYAVDVKVHKGSVLVASGSKDKQVRLNRQPRHPEALCDSFNR